MKNIKIFLIISLVFFIQSSSSFCQSQHNSKINEGFADIVEKLLPSVVNISSTQKPKENIDQILNKLPEDRVFDQLKNMLQKENLKQQQLSSLGSGFIISKDGYIVTKYHVIENSQQITVSLNDGQKFIAKIVGVDKKTDSALLKINPTTDLQPVKLGDSSKSKIGDWVIVIGNPFGLGSSVSVGIISARGRDIISGQGDFIQTDAAINRGNSGGPLFNNKGEVIGVATAIFSNSGGNIGIGFANVIEVALPVIEQLKSQGEVIRGWIGVSIEGVTEEMAKALEMKKPIGALVIADSYNGPALEAGILPSDIIIKFDGKTIKEMKMLPQIVSQTKIGKKVEVVVIRQGKQKTILVEVKKMPADLSGTDLKEETKPSTKVLGLDLINLDKETRKQYHIADDIQGVLVFANKSAQSPENSLLEGDIILSANQTQVKSISDLQKIILEQIKKNKKTLMLLVKREEQNLGVIINLN